ncbi:MAG: hypothetical protein ACYDHP_06545 [Ferrimicrobium sp.]
MSDGSFNLGDEVLNRLVYQPLGLLSAVLKALPNAAEEGKRVASGPVRTAQFVSQMAAGMARARYGDQIRNVEDKVEGVRRTVEDTVTRIFDPSGGSKSSGTATVVDTDAAEATTSRPGSVGGISEYDFKTAAQIIDELAGLTSAQLIEVEHFELSHRKRRTILARVSRIREGGA